MNRYSIAVLVGFAALCAGLSSGVPGKETIAIAATGIGTGWHHGVAFIRHDTIQRDGVAQH
ncbi:MAG TPA: hypothetical protein VF463_20505 [Sphingobium sp.]